jgi:hypothetical protein
MVPFKQEPDKKSKLLPIPKRVAVPVNAPLLDAAAAPFRLEAACPDVVEKLTANLLAPVGTFPKLLNVFPI